MAAERDGRKYPRGGEKQSGLLERVLTVLIWLLLTEEGREK